MLLCNCAVTEGLAESFVVVVFWLLFDSFSMLGLGAREMRTCAFWSFCGGAACVAWWHVCFDMTHESAMLMVDMA